MDFEITNNNQNKALNLKNFSDFISLPNFMSLCVILVFKNFGVRQKTAVFGQDVFTHTYLRIFVLKIIITLLGIDLDGFKDDHSC